LARRPQLSADGGADAPRPTLGLSTSSAPAGLEIPAFGRSQEGRKRTKVHENENAFICFLLFSGIETFQWVLSDSNHFFLPPHPHAALVPAIARSVFRLAWQYSHFSGFGK
jgi:hypothetical protein